MRTKTLLLAAVLSAAGAATSLAQVYSVNAVGYINVSLGVGYTMIANQLNASPSNSLETIFGSALGAGDTVFKFNGVGFDSAVSAGGGVFLYSTPSPFTLSPGEGAFVQTDTAKTVTFVGEVPQGPLNVVMVAGYNLVSSIVPQSVGLGSIGFPIAASDTVFFYNGTGFDSYISLDTTATNWLPSSPTLPAQPTPAVGQSFFVQRTAGATWTRNFVVN